MTDGNWARRRKARWTYDDRAGRCAGWFDGERVRCTQDTHDFTCGLRIEFESTDGRNDPVRQLWWAGSHARSAQVRLLQPARV